MSGAEPGKKTDIAHALFKAVLTISDDRLKAFLEATPISPEKTQVTPTELELSVAKFINNEFLEHQQFEEMASELSKGRAVSARRIAKGIAPKPGRDGRILFLVKKFEKSKPGETVEFVDQRFIKHFDNIYSQTKLARIYPPQPGVPGKDIAGKAIPVPTVKPVALSLDASIERESNPENVGFDELIAKKAGLLAEEKGKLVVSDHLVIEGDVDFRFGNIDFVGAVTIRGDVMKEFTVLAEKDIVISGSVYGATVISRQGSVKVAGGLFGAIPPTLSEGQVVSEAGARELVASRCIVRALGEIVCHTMDGAEIESFLDVKVEKEVRNSVIRTRTVLFIPNGSLMGGMTISSCGVEALSIGSKVGAETVVRLCSGVEFSEEYGKLEKQVATLKKGENLLLLHLGVYAEHPERIEALNLQYRSKLKVLLEKLTNVRNSLEATYARMKELSLSSGFNPRSRVNFHQTAHVGVHVQAGQVHHYFQKSESGPKSLIYDNSSEEFSLVSIEPLECAFGDHASKAEKEEE